MLKKLYVSPRGGLGNQLYSLSIGLLLAQLTKKDLVIDLRNVSARKSSILDFEILPKGTHGISLVGNSREKSKQGYKIAFIRAYLEILSRLKPQNKPIIGDLLRKINDKSIYSNEDYLIDGHFENLEVPHLSQSFSADFDITLKKPGESFLSFQTEINQLTENQIGIHVRRGDFAIWEGGVHLLPLEYYSNAISRATSDLDSYKIWVFTDEPESIQDVLDLNSNAEVVSRRYAMTDSEELLALSMMNKIITSRSTFSQWASIFSTADVLFPEGSQSLSHWIEVKFR